MLVISREDALLVFPAAATSMDVGEGWGQASGLFHLTSKHHCTITVIMLIQQG